MSRDVSAHTERSRIVSEVSGIEDAQDIHEVVGPMECCEWSIKCRLVAVMNARATKIL